MRQNGTNLPVFLSRIFTQILHQYAKSWRIRARLFSLSVVEYFQPGSSSTSSGIASLTTRSLSFSRITSRPVLGEHRSDKLVGDGYFLFIFHIYIYAKNETLPQIYSHAHRHTMRKYQLSNSQKSAYI